MIRLTEYAPEVVLNLASDRLSLRVATHTYRFLNAQQLLRLGVATQESYLRRVLKRFD